MSLRFVFGDVIAASYPSSRASNPGFEVRGWGLAIHTGWANYCIGYSKTTFLWYEAEYATVEDLEDAAACSGVPW